MARFLSPDTVLKSPRTTRRYHVEASARWRDDTGLRPPAYIIGVGGFGATYRVVDDQGRAYAMKEYFPYDFADRGRDGRITPKASEGGTHQKIFEEGLRRFVAESHMLISFNHDSICRVVDTFDDNGTSYQVMRLIEGRETLDAGDGRASKVRRRVTLDDYLGEVEAAGIEIDLPLIEPILKQLLDALQYIHTEGARKAQAITGETTRAVLHRDIKPGNILIEAPPGLEEAPAVEILRSSAVKAILIDFGSARIFRDVEDDDVSRSIPVATMGYSPVEVERNNADLQGPHSDIFSLAAVIWRALVGKKPDTTSLANGAKLALLAKPISLPDGGSRPRAPKAFLDAVDRALSAGTLARPQTVAEWRAELWPAAGGNVEKGGTESSQQPAPKGAGSKTRLYLGLAAAAVAAIVGGAFLVWNAGGVERHITEQAELAYKQALRISADATDAADRAAKDAGQAVYESGLSWTAAIEGRVKYGEYEKAAAPRHHSGRSGDSADGDRQSTLVDTQGNSVWCHKRDPGVVPDPGYESDPYARVKFEGQDGWACVPHTHTTPRDFPGPRNPWHVAEPNYEYSGQVDEAQRIAGHGRLTVGGTSLGGKFKQAGYTGLNATGVAALGDGSRKGAFWIRLSHSLIELQSGEVVDRDGRTTFQGRLRDGERLGAFMPAAGEKFVGVEAGSPDLRAGEITRADGSKVTFVSTVPAQSGTSGASWGQIQIGERIYRGEIRNGKPSGCGVWQGGKASFFVDGLPTADAGSACKQARYAMSQAVRDALASLTREGVPVAPPPAPVPTEAAAPAAAP